MVPLPELIHFFGTIEFPTGFRQEHYNVTLDTPTVLKHRHIVSRKSYLDILNSLGVDH